MQPNSWCRNLSNKVRLLQRPDGNIGYQPCCWMHNTIPVSNKQNLETARIQFSDMVMSDKETYCSECIRREKLNNNLSHRQLVMQHVPDDAEHGDVNVLELQIDTVCNAACTICGPEFSSLWRKQLKINEPVVNESVKLYHMFDLHKITNIRLLGGEPMLSNDYIQLLKTIPNPENITVQYNTNGSIFPDSEMLKIWSNYKKIILIFSIDDIDQRFGYVRWPLRWNKVSQNFQFVKANLKNADIGINCTVNAMSVYYIDQLQSWSNSVGNKKLKFSKCFGPWGLSACPDTVRSLVRQKLGHDHEICKILDQEPHCPSATQALVSMMNDFDTKRGTNWREIFAEIQQYF